MTSRILIGYTLQNIAFLINIYRWELILKVAGTIKNGLTITEDSNESELPLYRRRVVQVNVFVSVGTVIYVYS